MCYDYRTDESGHIELSVYDPNEPFQSPATGSYEVVLRRSQEPEHAEFPYELIGPHSVDLWRGFFVQQYRPYVPGARVINTQAT